MMSVKSKKFFVAVLSLSILITSIISVLTAFEFVHAETETLQEKIVRYTEDDFLEGEPNVTINEFAEKYKKGEYRPAGYPNGYPVTDIINKVVPKELFYTAGAHAYMGQEYGFIVYTYTNNTGISYYSQMLLIDFDFIIPEDSTSERNPVVTQPIYRMETILEAFLETSNDQGQSDWEIYQPQSWLGTDIYLQNVVISANLENENEYNAYDLNYDKQNDGGSIIEYATVDYCAHENVGKTNFGPITEWGVDILLTKGLRNKNASTAIAGTVEIEYQNDVVTFYPELEIITDTYKQYFAYVVNSANATDIPKTITVSVMSAGKIIEELCQDAVFNGDTFILDLSSYFIPEESYSFNCEICVNNSEIIALDPIEISNPVKENEETVTTSHSAEYVYLKYTKTQDFINKQINIPGNVKVLNIQASYSYYIRGLCFNIQAADSPLIININAIDIFAPSLLPTIKSNRDIILNCFGTVRLTGGFGINDGVLGDEDGLPAIQMHDNLLIINGSGSLTLEGGDGGNTSDGQEFYYNSTAGSGGTAIEVGDLVLNVSRLTIRGGDGGDGGDGIDGADGIDGVGYQENGVGARGTDGEYGGYACGGGNAGMGVWILGDMCVIYTTNLTISGGGAGNGGKGGDGGDGGDGAKGKDGGIFGGQCGGGNAGNGGNGCYGGDFGTGMIAFNEYDIHKIINLSGINYDAMLKEWSPDGIGGAGGKGGKGGTGGEGGKNFWGTRAPSGADGIDGIDGSPGGDPRPYPYRVSTNLLNNSSTIEQDRSNLIIEYMIRRIGIEKVAMLYDI